MFPKDRKGCRPVLKVPKPHQSPVALAMFQVIRCQNRGNIKRSEKWKVQVFLSQAQGLNTKTCAYHSLAYLNVVITFYTKRKEFILGSSYVWSKLTDEFIVDVAAQTFLKTTGVKELPRKPSAKPHFDALDKQILGCQPANEGEAVQVAASLIGQF